MRQYKPTHTTAPVEGTSKTKPSTRVQVESPRTKKSTYQPNTNANININTSNTVGSKSNPLSLKRSTTAANTQYTPYNVHTPQPTKKIKVTPPPKKKFTPVKASKPPALDMESDDSDEDLFNDYPAPTTYQKLSARLQMKAQANATASVNASKTFSKKTTGRLTRNSTVNVPPAPNATPKATKTPVAVAVNSSLTTACAFLEGIDDSDDDEFDFK